MKVIALCKTFRGAEFVQAMIDSIYDHVYKIVFVHSNTSWMGKVGGNVAKAVKELYPNDSKIINLEKDFDDQIEQYDYGIEYIRKTFPEFTHFMFIDTDEVFDPESLKWCYSFLRSNPSFNAYRVPMKSYLKTPFFQIDAMDNCKPVVFIKKDADIKGIRGIGMEKQTVIDGAYLHHYNAVRDSLEEVVNKFIESHTYDKCNMRDMEEWVTNVWNDMPNAKKLHPSVRFAETWDKIKVLALGEVPPVVAKLDIMNHLSSYHILVEGWYKGLPDFGEANQDNEFILHKYSKGAAVAAVMGGVAKNPRYACIISRSAKKVYAADGFKPESMYGSFVKMMNKYRNIMVCNVILHEFMNSFTDIDFMFLDDREELNGDFQKMMVEVYGDRIKKGGILAISNSFKYYGNGVDEKHNDIVKFCKLFNKDKRFCQIDRAGNITIWKKVS